MGNLMDLLNNLEHAPVFLIFLIDLVFLVVLLCVFEFHAAAELQTVIKEAFIGWNGALMLAINVSRKTMPSSTDPTDPTKS